MVEKKTRSTKPAFDRAADIPSLSQGYKELGKRSLLSSHSIITKIRHLANDLKNNPEKSLSDDDREVISLIGSTLPEIEETLQDDEQRRLLKGVDRYIRILLSEDEKRRVKQEEKNREDTRFNRVKYLEEDFAQTFPSIGRIREVAVNDSDYTPTGVRKLKEDYPPKNDSDGNALSLEGKKAIVDKDLDNLRSTLGDIRSFVLISLDSDPQGEEKKSTIEEIAIPVLLSFIEKLEERQKEIETAIHEEQENAEKAEIERKKDEFKAEVLGDPKVRALINAFRNDFPSTESDLEQYAQELQGLHASIDDNSFNKRGLAEPVATELLSQIYKSRLTQELDQIAREAAEKRNRVFSVIVDRILEVRESNIASYSQAELVQLQEQLQTERVLARKNKTTLVQLDDVSDVDKAEEHIRRMIELRRHPKYLTLKQIVDEILLLQLDPYDYGTLPEEDRGRKLCVRFDELTANQISPDFRNPEEMERIIQKLRASLVAMDVSLKNENKNAATSDRDRLTQVMNAKKVTRREILIGVTQHPKWGESIRSLLKEIIETSVAASRGGGGSSTDKLLAYSNLVGSTGRDDLKTWIRLHPSCAPIQINSTDSPNNVKKKQLENERRAVVREFTEVLFNSFDMLSDILRILQKRTFTPAHYPLAKNRRRIADPASSAVHAAQRDGGTLFTPENHFWVFQKITDDYCASAVKRMELRAVQQLERMRRVALNGPAATEIFDSILPARGLDTHFPTTYHWMMLIDGERVDYEDGTTSGVKEPVDFDTAESGAEEILNLLVSKVPNDLTIEQIVGNGTKGIGMLAEITKAGGKAKIVADGKFLKEVLEPITTDYVLRLVYALENESVAYRADAFKQIVEVLHRNGIDSSLSDFRFELHLVIRNLLHDDCKPKLYYTDSSGEKRDGSRFVRRLEKQYIEEELQKLQLRRKKTFTDKEISDYTSRIRKYFSAISLEVASNLSNDIEQILNQKIKMGKSDEVMSKSFLDPFLYNNGKIKEFVNAYYAYQGWNIPRTRYLPNPTEHDLAYWAYLDQIKPLPKVFYRIEEKK